MLHTSRMNASFHSPMKVFAPFDSQTEDIFVEYISFVISLPLKRGRLYRERASARSA